MDYDACFFYVFGFIKKIKQLLNAMMFVRQKVSGRLYFYLVK